MRIGFDFDNTIVNYDPIFHTVAKEKNLIPADFPVSKIAVRDYLRSIHQEDRWTEMQGYVYGDRMSEAEAYPGALRLIRLAKEAGHTLAIISHKTKHNFLGAQYDLHHAARRWIQCYLCENHAPFIPESQVFFELTKDEKLARIGSFGCDLFLDDLPEILLAANFPQKTRRFLFDPQKNHLDKNTATLEVISSWSALEARLGLA